MWGDRAFNRPRWAKIDIAIHLMEDNARDTREPVVRYTGF